MSGIHMALLGSAGSPVVTNGTGELVIITSYTYFHGYDGAAGGGSILDFGSITNGVFKDATLKAVYSASNPGSINVNRGQAISYSVIFNGNRSAGFFNTLTVNNTLIVGTLGSPAFNSGNNETTFTITLASQVASQFGSTDGVLITVTLT